MKKILYVLLVVISSINAQNEMSKWGQTFLNNPEKYFRSSYELGIFKNFKSKFSNLKLNKIAENGSQRILDLQIDNKVTQYQLVLEIDEEEMIRYAYRYHENLNLNKNNFSNENILKWIGKFFYYIDSGDTAAIHDMIFQKEVEIIYNKQKKKSIIISNFLKDFPAIVQPTKTDIIEETSSLAISMVINLYADLYIKIPDKLIYPLDTDYLQETFFNRIINNLRNSIELPGDETSLTKDELIGIFKRKYKGSNLKNNTIIIPYKTKRFQKLESVQYFFSGSFFKSEVDISKIVPQIDLTHNETDGTLELNNSYSMSCSGLSQINQKSTEEIKRAIQYIYRMILAISPSNKETLIKGWTRFRGLLVNEVELTNARHWNSFWSSLWDEGEIFYYPSIIDYSKEDITIKGVVYVFPESESFFYHFGELTAVYRKNETNQPYALRLVFYPFIRDEASSFYENE